MKTEAKWEARARELSSVADALRLGREMAQEAADARAEEIAQALDRFAQRQRDLADENQRACRPIEGKVLAATAFTIAAEHARSTITKPKTREQVLEQALRAIAQEDDGCPNGEIARRALEWKPEESS